MSFFIYEREELASYIPVAKLFLRSHPSASGGVQLPCSLAGCPPARCRSSEVRPVRCCFGLVPRGNTRLRVTIAPNFEHCPRCPRNVTKNKKKQRIAKRNIRKKKK